MDKLTHSENNKTYCRPPGDKIPQDEHITKNKELHQKIIFLHRIFRYNHEIGLMEYAVNDCELTYTDISPEACELFFPMKEFQNQGTKCLFDSQGPLFVANKLGLVQILVSHFDEHGFLQYCCGLGPVFTTIDARQNAPGKLRSLTLSVKEFIICQKTLPALPVVPLQTMVEYAIMMHGCMNNEKITPGDIHYNYTDSDSYPEEGMATEENLSKNRMTSNVISAKKTWNAIQAGNISYIENNNPSFFVGFQFSKHRLDSLRLAKDYCLMVASTCLNAAVHGGLSALEANDVLDNYLYHFELCQNEADLYRFLHALELDFATRVRRVRHADHDPVINECISYIQSHQDKDLRLEDVARALHYSPNHLGKRFQEAVGKTFREYMTEQKITLAKELLPLSGVTAAEVAALCHFSSASYFSKVFLKHVGMTPQEYAHSAREEAKLP